MSGKRLAILVAAGAAALLWRARRSRRTAPRQNTHDFREIAERIDAVFWIRDLQTLEVVYVSPGYHQLWGAPPPRHPDERIAFFETVHPLDRARVEAAVKAQSNERGMDEEFRIIRPDGETRWVWIRTFPGYDAVSARHHLFGVAQDISERKRAEVAMHETRDLLEQTFASLKDAVFVVDPVSRAILNWNAAAERIFGYTHDEVAAQDGTRILHVSDAHFEQFGREALAAYDRVGYYETDFVMRRKDGQIFPTRHFVRPLYDNDGRIARVVSLVRDLTEEQQTEAALHQQRHLLERITALTPAVIYLYDLVEQRNVYANRGIEVLLGYTPADVQAMGSDMFARLMHPDDIALLPQRMARFPLMSDDDVNETEYRMKNRAGGWHWLFSREVIFSRSDDGTPRQVLGIAQDITTLKQAEASLRQSEERLHELNRALEARIAERTARLAASEAAEHEQRVLADLLRETAAVLNSTLDLDTVLDHIAARIGLLIPYDVLDILLIDDDDGSVCTARSREADAGWQARDPQALWSLGRPGDGGRDTVLIADTQGHPAWPRDERLGRVRSFAGAPVIVDGEVIGLIAIGSTQAQFFNETHESTLMAFTDQAALAVRNARLYARARELAAVEERQRLARDLHDAVTQTVFSANVVARTLLRLRDNAPEKMGDSLIQLSLLTRSALAEMRTLLLELRPEALAETSLGKLVLQLGDAYISRIGSEVRVVVEGDAAVSAPVKETFYRVAQEALNNVSKHAQASSVGLRLVSAAGVLSLMVEDDGRGFEVERVAPPHLGLKIMRERAAAIGAALTIDSQPGGGTRIEIRWKAEGQS